MLKLVKIAQNPLVGVRVGKNKIHEHCGVKFFFNVLRQIFKFFPKFRSLNVQIRNNFKYITFIDCKWCNICKYYVNNMVIFCSTCQREETECTWVKYLIYAVWSQFQIFVIYAFFSPNLYFQSLEYFNLVLLFFLPFLLKIPHPMWIVAPLPRSF